MLFSSSFFVVLVNLPRRGRIVWSAQHIYSGPRPGPKCLRVFFVCVVVVVKHMIYLCLTSFHRYQIQFNRANVMIAPQLLKNARSR